MDFQEIHKTVNKSVHLISPPPLSLSKQKTGLQITTHPLVNASYFFCGRQKLKDLITHLAGEICRTLLEPDWFNFHFCLHYLQPIKYFIQLDCSLDQHHTKSRKGNVEIYSGGYHVKNIFFFVTAFNIALKMWVPKYQCGLVKLKS